MAQILKQSTAVDVLIGPFVDKTNALDAETGESPSVKLSKNGQALAAKNDATTPVHDADGYYNCELDATDTNTVGTLILTVAGSSEALPVRHEFQVLEGDIYDALYATNAAAFDGSQRVDVGSWVGNTVTASSGNPDVNVESIDDIDAPTTWKNSVNAECDQALTDYDAVVPADLPTNFGSLGIEADGHVHADVKEWVGNTVTASSGNPDVNVESIDDIDAPATWKASINAEADSAIETYGLDHLLSASVTGTDITDNSIIAKLVSKEATADWDDFANTDDSLQAIRDHIGDGTNLTEAGGDGDHLTEAGGDGDHLTEAGGDGDHLTEAGGTGDQLTAVPYNSAWDAEIQSEVTDALNAYDPPTKAELDTLIPNALNTTALGNVGVDWANVENPSSTVDLSATDIQLADTTTDVTNQVSADVTAISGDSAAADNLEASLETLALGTVSGSGSTTSTVDTDITGEGDDTFIGRVLIFRTGALKYEAGTITDYDSTSGTCTFAASTFTDSASNTDAFVIV